MLVLLPVEFLTARRIEPARQSNFTAASRKQFSGAAEGSNTHYTVGSVQNTTGQRVDEVSLQLAWRGQAANNVSGKNAKERLQVASSDSQMTNPLRADLHAHICTSAEMTVNLRNIFCVNASYTVSTEQLCMKILMRCYSWAKNHQVLKYHAFGSRMGQPHQ